MNGLYLGKFQPFHKGHLKAFEFLDSLVDNVKIGLGSPQFSQYFDLTERIQMIKDNTGIEPLILKDLDKEHPYYLDWGGYILSQIGDIDIVLSGNEDVRNDFLKHKIPVIWLPRFYEVSGTEIRKRIFSRNESWRDLVSEKSATIIEKSTFYQRYNQ